MAKVLLVGRDPVFGALLEDRLRIAGHEVHAAHTHAVAASLALERQADLLILDTSLAVVEPIIRELRTHAATRSLPLLVLADPGPPAGRVAALTAGADDYVARPFDVEEIVIRCVRLLGGSSRQAMLQGDLSVNPIWAVLQQVQQLGQTGRLAVRSGNASGAVEVFEGQPIAAQWQTLRGREALLALVSADRGSFHFDANAQPTSPSEGLGVSDILMHAAWLKDELESRRHLLPSTGAPLRVAAGTPTAPPERFSRLPLQRLLARVVRTPGLRLFDLLADDAEAPLTTRLCLALLIEHGAVTTQSRPLGPPQSTVEITNEIAFDAGVGSLLGAARRAGFDTAALPCLVLAEQDAWADLLRLIQQAPGYSGNEALVRLVDQIERRQAGSATFSCERERLSLQVQILQKSSPERLATVLAGCASVLAWIVSPEGTTVAGDIVRRLDATGSRAARILVAGSHEVQATVGELAKAGRDWRFSPEPPRSLLGLFRLLEPKGRT